MDTLSLLMAARFRAWHAAALRCVEDVTDDQALWRPPRGPQAMTWQLWHIARWDDRFAQIIAELAPSLEHDVPRDQVWARENVRVRWGWKDIELGRREAGTGLSDEQAAALPFPTLEFVREYATQAFGYAESAVAALAPDAMLEPAGADVESWAANVLQYLEHLPEHVAVMNALRAWQGLPTQDS
jgi:DinB family protein